MQRDWSLEMMLRLTDVMERDRASYLAKVDDQLDSLSMELAELQKQAAISAFGLNRALGWVNRLRGELETARSAADVRQAFTGIDDLKSVVDEGRAVMKERGRPS